MAWVLGAGLGCKGEEAGKSWEAAGLPAGRRHSCRRASSSCR